MNEEKETKENLQEQLEALKEEVSRLKKEKKETKEELKLEGGEKFAFIRQMNGQLVVGWDKNLKRFHRKTGEPYDVITLHLLNKNGEETKKDFEYLDFIRNSDRVKVVILDETTKMHVEFQGYTTKKYVQDYRTIDTGIKVPVKIETPEVIYKIKIIEGEFKGKELTLPAEYLN